MAAGAPRTAPGENLRLPVSSVPFLLRDTEREARLVWQRWRCECPLSCAPRRWQLGLVTLGVP